MSNPATIISKWGGIMHSNNNIK